jgi:hypothetical protein
MASNGLTTRARRRLTAGLGATAVAAGTLVAAAPAEPAGAWCEGRNRPWSLIDYFAVEDTRAGTCDGDLVYRGTIRDTREDGWCVFVNFADVGRDFGVHARSCTRTGTAFTWYDQGGGNGAYERVCIDGYRDCSVTVGNRGY